ncbi:MAG TPA: ADP-forming succinate--CoA ligase subunit beta [Elusimicrobiota bacterium]|nr:ADP-forming succinate--CoA ligase subunit beta [Elusimicrobiota bacterium]
MKLLEWESKEILKARGVPVPPSGGVIETTGRLGAALKKAGKGPWVIKAQVLAGGRGKAGGIKVAKTPKEAQAVAKSILGMTLSTHQTAGQGIKVDSALIEGAAKIEKEYYFSVVLDRQSASPVVVASGQGGMEIESLAAEKLEAILRVPVDVDAGLPAYAARRLAFAMGIPTDKVGEFSRMARALCRIFLDYDLSLLEINPLALTSKGLAALDAKIVADDNALFRHSDLEKLPDHESSALEKAAKKAGISYVGLDGNIGCMVNGAGLAMATMDTIGLAGGTPANFLDVGGSADEERVTKAFTIILKDPKVEAVLVNIFGGIVKCDVIAGGILAALKKVKMRVPLVVRLQGTNVDKGKELLARSGLKLIQADDLWGAAQKAVTAARGAKEAA